ncbi:MAG TPA: FAD-dependent oxidoreductase [Caulobacteraceae bacterium]|jgi:thioredoxin reductase|nr:FAD-dependent oxidoreductase [Caulobacteraceae bacterium]
MSAQRGFDRISQAGKVPPPDEQVQILVVGGGAAGASAAIAAAKAGASVMLVDENPVSPGLMGLDTPLYFGGRYSNAVQAQGRMVEQILASNPLLEAAFEAGVDVRLGVYVWGAFTPGWGLASLPSAIAGLADEERAWTVGFERLILATGARDVAFAFRGWDQPGVMGARAFQALMGRYDAFSGRRLVILGTGELAIQTARTALASGLEVAALIDVSEAFQGPSSAAAELRAADVEILLGQIPIGASGGLEGIEGLTVRDLAAGATRAIACDTVVEAISLTPVVELLDVLGGAIAPAPLLGGHAPVSPDGTATSLANVFLAGDVAGAPGGVGMGEDAARASGHRAAQAVLASLGHDVALGAVLTPGPGFDALAYQMTWARALMAEPDVIICQCEEVTRADLVAVKPPTYLGPPSPAQARRDLASLLEDGPPNQDQIKRLTRACMGPCQARRCREQVALTLACASNAAPSDVPLAGYRAPVRALPLKVLAAWDESPEIARYWDVWMGIPGQWTPYDDIGTEREALSAGILGEGGHA